MDTSSFVMSERSGVHKQQKLATTSHWVFCNMMTDSNTVTGNNLVAAQGTRIIVFIQNPLHFRVRPLPGCQPKTGLGNGTA